MSKKLSNKVFAINKKKANNFNILLILFFVSFFTLFFLSPDSYLYDLYYRCDSAWFFMCGKAWMSGLIPYIDFSDSKGPLLWLIYGIGYLINNHTYIGVFWLSVVSYTITLYFCYQIAILYLQDSHRSLAVAILMIIPYFFILIHDEVRAEDFCQPFIISSLYGALYVKQYPQYFAKWSFLIGISIAGCFLIKWNIAITSTIFAISILIDAYKNHCFSKTLLWGILGILSICIPFAIYFIIIGNFTAFIQEYFIQTFQTFSDNGKNPIYTYLDMIHLNMSRIFKLSLISVYIIGAIYFCKRQKTNHWPLIFTAFFTFIIYFTCNYIYYFSTFASFAIFLIITLLDTKSMKLLSSQKILKFSFGLGILYILFICSYNYYSNSFNFFFQKDNRQSFYTANYLFSQVKSPKILNMKYEHGIGTPSNVLPACKYWALQNGATKAMRDERKIALENKIADFIISDNANDSLLYAHGYQKYLQVELDIKNHKNYLYGKPGLKMPPKNFMPNNVDILLKRKINFIK